MTTTVPEFVSLTGDTAPMLIVGKAGATVNEVDVRWPLPLSSSVTVTFTWYEPVWA